MRLKMVVTALVAAFVVGATPAAASAGPVGDTMCDLGSSFCTLYQRADRILCPVSGWTCGT